MAKDELPYQKGICRNCPEERLQRFLFATNHRVEPRRDERGRLDYYGHVQTFSLFHCDGCKAVLFYKTPREDVVDVEWLDEMNPEWVTELDEDEFKKRSTQLYPPVRTCSKFVPQSVKKHYQVALEVKDRNANLFAVQIRTTLEEICLEQGARRDKLWKMLEELSTKGVLPPTLAEIARELRDTGNKGAHPDSVGVRNEDAEAIDDFFRMIINYVYDAPAKLNAFRKLLPELIQASDDTIH